jgi:cytochrome c oxidase subunit 2
MVSWLNPRSPEAQAIVQLFASYLILAAVVFLVVAALVVYGIVRYRGRQGAPDPPQHTGSRTLEITWTAIPLLILVAFFVLTVRTMAFVDAPQEPTQTPDVVIVGQQWWWEARYPNGAVAVNEIHMPAGRRVLARVESADVVHDFWAPQLARKIDAVPGRPSYLWIEADAPGTYEGTCSEFCGMQHAGMRFQVIAEPQATFPAWLKAQAELPSTPTAGPAAEGSRLFRERKCSDCHAVTNSHAGSEKGPPLTHIASRKRLGGALPNTGESLARWIAAPQAVKPGNHMPDQQLPPAEVQALVAYMESLR